MTRTLTHILAAVALGVALLAASCSSKKDAVTQNTYTPEKQTPQTNPAQTVYTAMTESYRNWNTLSVPVKINLEQPKRISLSGTAKMINDQAVNISLRMLGLIEVAQIYIDADSTVIVSKPMSLYCTESTARLASVAGIDIADIQCLLLGRAFLPGNGAATPGSFKKFTAQKNSSLKVTGAEVFDFSPAKSSEKLKWTYTVVAPAEGTPSLGAVNLTADGTGTVLTAYATPQATEAGPVSPQCSAEAQAGKHKFTASLVWSLDRAKWNSALTIAKPTIPKGARRVTVEKALEMLKKL